MRNNHNNQQMIITKLKTVSVLAVLILMNCTRPKSLGVLLLSGFKEDKVKVVYANKLILDSILTTNESQQLAHIIILPKIEERYLCVCVNDKICDSIIVKKSICGVYIAYRNTKIKFTADSICKPINFY